MASIFPRKNKDNSTTWRVQIRRKGLKPFITSFSSEEKAKEFVNVFEKKYVMDSESFEWDHLRQIRENEFDRMECVYVNTINR